MLVHGIARPGDVVFEDREEDQGGDAGGEPAVVEHEAAVQRVCGGAQSGAEHAGRDTSGRPVPSDDRTETGGKGGAVEVGLCGDRPNGISADQVVKKHG